MTAVPSSLVWFVTGCSSGFGRSLVARVLERGDRVVATARQGDALAELATRFPDRCEALTLDVTNPEAVAGVVAKAAARFGTLDVVVNNAGAGLVGAVEELSDAEIAASLQVNFLGALAVTRAALPVFRAQRRGHFVMLSAAAVIGNYPGFSIYGAGKAALESMAEALAAEVRPFGVKVTIVQPGPFRTDFIRSLRRAGRRISDYDPTSGKFAQYLATASGKQPGDPLKAADAIITAVQSERPPLRLILGRYAIDKARRKYAASLRELEAWEAIGAATDF